VHSVSEWNTLMLWRYTTRRDAMYPKNPLVHTHADRMATVNDCNRRQVKQLRHSEVLPYGHNNIITEAVVSTCIPTSGLSAIDYVQLALDYTLWPWPFDLLTSESMHNKWLPCTVRLLTFVLIAQAVFILKCGQIDTHTHTHTHTYSDGRNC